jgi:hypothetical protein
MRPRRIKLHIARNKRFVWLSASKNLSFCVIALISVLSILLLWGWRWMTFLDIAHTNRSRVESSRAIERKPFLHKTSFGLFARHCLESRRLFAALRSIHTDTLGTHTALILPTRRPPPTSTLGLFPYKHSTAQYIFFNNFPSSFEFILGSGLLPSDWQMLLWG